MQYTPTKPAKPSPDFPLFAHNSGKWAKKIGGKLKYFGRWADPDGALAAYKAASDTLSVKQVSYRGLSIKDACNLFLHAKEQQVAAGALSSRSFLEYRQTCQRLAEWLGKDKLVVELTPAEFAGYRDWRAATWNLIAVGNEITRIRTMFKWLHASEHLREPARFGPDFRRPSAKAIRRHRRLAGPKLFTADQVRFVLNECGLHLRAMVLLGINCGFGNSDVANLPLTAWQFERPDLIDFPRPKTEVDRICPLWPETTEALRASLAARHKPQPQAADQFFVTAGGLRWDNPNLPVAKQFRQALNRVLIKRGGFYWLRHTFQTIGDGAKDPVAVASIMGHADASMSAVYREEVALDRLRAVVDHVRWWLFG